MSREHIFHLAIPCRDLDEAARFYGEGLGCRIARRYDDRITVDFFGDQVVCHLDPERIDQELRMYPRHFGVTFRDRESYDRVLRMAEERQLRFFAKPSTRFAGKREAHGMFFLVDPSNNLLEFKCYDDPAMMY